MGRITVQQQNKAGGTKSFVRRKNNNDGNYVNILYAKVLRNIAKGLPQNNQWSEDQPITDEWLLEHISNKKNGNLYLMGIHIGFISHNQKINYHTLREVSLLLSFSNSNVNKKIDNNKLNLDERMGITSQNLNSISEEPYCNYYHNLTPPSEYIQPLDRPWSGYKSQKIIDVWCGYFKTNIRVKSNEQGVRYVKLKNNNTLEYEYDVDTEFTGGVGGDKIDPLHKNNGLGAIVTPTQCSLSKNIGFVEVRKNRKNQNRRNIASSGKYLLRRLRKLSAKGTAKNANRLEQIVSFSRKYPPFVINKTQPFVIFKNTTKNDVSTERPKPRKPRAVVRKYKARPAKKKKSF